jgi:hypothetical protein
MRTDGACAVTWRGLGLGGRAVTLGLAALLADPGQGVRARVAELAALIAKRRDAGSGGQQAPQAASKA